MTLQKLPLVPDPARVNDISWNFWIELPKFQIRQQEPMIRFSEPGVHVDSIIARIPYNERQIVFTIKRIAEKVVLFGVSEDLTVQNPKCGFPAHHGLETGSRRRVEAKDGVVGVNLRTVALGGQSPGTRDDGAGPEMAPRRKTFPGRENALEKTGGKGFRRTVDVLKV